LPTFVVSILFFGAVTKNQKKEGKTEMKMWKKLSSHTDNGRAMAMELENDSGGRRRVGLGNPLVHVKCMNRWAPRVKFMHIC